jgi:glycosyltransferase involved in cell wall biosynthesis
VYCITDTDMGGAEQCVLYLATRIDRTIWRPVVVSLMPPGGLARSLEHHGVPVYSTDLRSKQAGRAIWRLARLFRRVRPALVHTFLFHANVAGRVAAWFAGVPRVVSSVRVAERRYAHHLRLENLTCRLADRILCVSGAVSGFMQRAAHLPASRLITIPNGVDIRRFDSATPAPRSLGGVPSDAVLAAFVGRLDFQKGADVLIQAVASIRDRCPRLHLWIVGQGSEERALRQLAVDLQVSDRCHFLGWQEDVAGLLRAADLFVLPSRWEGMANVILEAMAAGLPVVASHVEGTAELVQPGLTGTLVPPGDPDRLAGAIEALTNDAALRRRWGQLGKNALGHEWSIDAMVRAHEQTYQQVIAAASE